MINPSNAGLEKTNGKKHRAILDPTVKRLVEITEKTFPEVGGFKIYNLYTTRSSKVGDINVKDVEPISAWNLKDKKAKAIVPAWGDGRSGDQDVKQRKETVYDLLKQEVPDKLFYLGKKGAKGLAEGFSKNKQPRHPLGFTNLRTPESGRVPPITKVPVNTPL